MTERDLMRAVGRGLHEQAVVADCMTSDPETVEADATTSHAAVLMIHGGFRHLPVVDGKDVVGMLSIRGRSRTFPARLLDPAAADVSRDAEPA
jgi:CBS domain-containing protein